MKIRELGNFQMLWDCYCGSGPYLGIDHKFCVTCGRAQDPSLRYFPNQNEAVSVPKEWENKGADHYCPYCQTANPVSVFCFSCGGPMDGSQEVEKRETNYGTEGETVEDAIQESRRELTEKRIEQAAVHFRKKEDTTPQVTPERVLTLRPEVLTSTYGRVFTPEIEDINSFGGWKQYQNPFLIGLGILSFIFVLWAIFGWEKEITAQVTSKTWSRSQIIEKFEKLTKENWCKSIPSDADIFLKHSEKSGTKTVVDCHDCDCHTEKVKIGETCRDTNCHTIRTDNGNGSYNTKEVCEETCTDKFQDKKVCKDKTHKEDVFEDWCGYHIDRWVPDRSTSLDGDGTMDPTWPPLTMDSCTKVHLGCERAGEKSEKYQVFFQDVTEHTKYTCGFSQKKWETLQEGSEWKATVKVLGGRFQCDSLEITQNAL